MRILVVCGGNTCRSPAAEAAIRRAARTAGLDLEVFSAGTSAGTAGEPPTEAMVRAGGACDLVITGIATQVTPEHLQSADLILAMDHKTVLFLQSLPGESTARIELLGSHDPSGAGPEIADPYGQGPDVYASVLDRIIAASEAVVSSLND